MHDADDLELQRLASRRWKSRSLW